MNKQTLIADISMLETFNDGESDLKDEIIGIIKESIDEGALTAKGEAMPQTIEAWQRLYGLAEDTMKRQDKVISRLKQRINKLEQDREQRDGC